MPCALTIAGSDSGGGAGIQADLKTYSTLRVHGLTAVTCVTAQNPAAVLAVQPVRPAILRLQLEAIERAFTPRAMKTGMLGSRSLIHEVIRFADRHRDISLVVDPVMVATSGSRLLQPSAMRALTRRLLPLATIITPNVYEAEVLSELKISTIEHQRTAARRMVERFGCAVVVKGGHLRGAEAADIFFDRRTELLLTAPFVPGVKTHGTGCMFSAAITAGLARGLGLTAALVQAKQFITRAIAGSPVVGGGTVLWPG